MQKHQTKILLPKELSFSFQAYLQEKGRQLLQIAGESIPYDNTLKLMGILEELHQDFFQLFGLKDKELSRNETKEKSGGTGIFDFPTDDYTITFQNSQAKYEITLSRMFNGHMGFYEDDVNAEFTFQDKKCRLACYIFVNNELKIETSGFTREEYERLILLLGNKISDKG